MSKICLFSGLIFFFFLSFLFTTNVKSFTRLIHIVKSLYDHFFQGEAGPPLSLPKCAPGEYVTSDGKQLLCVPFGTSCNNNILCYLTQH